MDQELIAYLDERFRETSRQIQGLREETSQRFDTVDKSLEQVDKRFEQVDKRLEQVDGSLEQMDEQLRLTGVRVEALQSQIQVVAEGVAAGNENLQAFRQTVALEFDNSRFQVNILFKDLNQRVRDIELRTGQPGIQS